MSDNVKVFDQDGHLVTQGWNTMEWWNCAHRLPACTEDDGWFWFPRTYATYYHLALHYPIRLQFPEATVAELLQAEEAARDKAPRVPHIFKRVPYHHQRLAFWEGCAHKEIALLFEQGLGKTKTALDILEWHYRQGHISSCLVIIPLSLGLTWTKEIQLNTQLTAVTVTGTAKRRRRLLQDTVPNIHIMGYDSVRATAVSQLRQFDCIICDESSLIANPSTKRSKEIGKLARAASYRMILSGTPVGNSIVNLFGQYKVLVPGLLGSTQYGFKQTYCVLGGYDGKDVIGYQRVGDLLGKVRRYSLRATKAGCLDLPGKIHITLRAPMPDEQRAATKSLKAEMQAELDCGGMITATMFLSRIQKFQQIASGHCKLDDKTTKIFKEQPKRDLLFPYLENHVKGSGAVIWTYFKASAAIIKAEMNKRGWEYVQIDGDTSVKDRITAETRFYAGDVQFFLASLTQAAAMGLNLQGNCFSAFYYDHVWSALTRAQSEDRLDRIGQTSKVMLYNLVIEKSVDEYVLNKLIKKQAFADVVADGKVREALLEI